MKKARNNQYAEHLFLVIVFCAALFLFLSNLGNQYLWEDEAETALISKTVLQYGIPKGYDGKNFFSQEGKISYGKNYIWALDPWLSYYLVAVFFKMFGVSTFTAKLSFSLFGVATVILTYFFARALTGNKKIAAVAASLLVLSVPFLVLSRQCRYYSLVAFFSVLGLYGYITLLKGRKSGSILFVVSAITLFHCNHLFCATLLATVLAHALICSRKQLPRVFVLSLIVVSVNLPWLIWISKLRYITLLSSYRMHEGGFLDFLWSYLKQIHYFVFPFFLLLIPLGKGFLFCISHRNIKEAVKENALLWKNLLLLLLFIFCTVVSLSIASPVAYFRYLAQLIPMFCIITAVIVTSIIKYYFKTGTIVIAILLGIVFFADYRYKKTYPSREGIKYLNFFDYIDEITHDYDGPIEGISKYLNENGNEDDVVLITYGDLPLKFYTNMRIVGGLTGEDLSVAANPDWVIARKYLGSPYALPVVRHLGQIPISNYERIVLNYPDITYENREDPAEHHFRTVINEDRVAVFRKIK
jgi:4-amino-4-deoxy-L-arabinose transferase-like glycosyltransferase